MGMPLLRYCVAAAGALTIAAGGRSLEILDPKILTEGGWKDSSATASEASQSRKQCSILELKEVDLEGGSNHEMECHCRRQGDEESIYREYGAHSCMEIINDPTFVDEQTLIVMNREYQDLQNVFWDFNLRETTIGHFPGLNRDVAVVASIRGGSDSSTTSASSRKSRRQRRLQDNVGGGGEDNGGGGGGEDNGGGGGEDNSGGGGEPSPGPPGGPTPTAPTAPIVPTTGGPTLTTTLEPSDSSSTTSIPVANPSSEPTNLQSPPPTSAQSARPTTTPLSPPPTALDSTFSPGKEIRPTRSPTKMPNKGPRDDDLESPSPTAEPSKPQEAGPPTRMSFSPPSSMPSPPGTPLDDQEFNVNLKMEMQLSRAMTEDEIRAFQLEVGKTIYESISNPNTDYGAPLSDVQVIANFVDQKLANPTTRSRRLQDLQDVAVRLGIRVIFKSPELREKSDVEVMIGDAFNSVGEREAFVTRLNGRDPFFGNAYLETVEVEGVQPEEDQLTTDDDEDDSNSDSTKLIIIASAAAGGVIALLALVLLVMRSGSSSKSTGTPIDLELAKEEQSRTMARTVSTFGVSAEILVERQDDISTLGDPTFGIGGITVNSERDEQTASIGNDYDYAKQYLRAQGMASTGSNRDRLGSGGSFGPHSSQSAASKLHGVVTPSVFSDDASFDQRFGEGARQNRFENRFEVVVPPGKLGMVIDTPNGGVPAVRAIKPESVLASKVRVGDRLVAVDGDDVTAMTTVQVSKLISLKADQKRVLAFVTTRAVRGKI